MACFFHKIGVTVAEISVTLRDVSPFILSAKCSIDNCMSDGSDQDCVVLEALHEEEPLAVQTVPPIPPQENRGSG